MCIRDRFLGSIAFVPVLRYSPPVSNIKPHQILHTSLFNLILSLGLLLMKLLKIFSVTSIYSILSMYRIVWTLFVQEVHRDGRGQRYGSCINLIGMSEYPSVKAAY